MPCWFWTVYDTKKWKDQSWFFMASSESVKNLFKRQALKDWNECSWTQCCTSCIRRYLNEIASDSCTAQVQEQEQKITCKNLGTVEYLIVQLFNPMSAGLADFYSNWIIELIYYRMSLFFLSFSTESLLLRNFYLLGHFLTAVMPKHTKQGH
jgi:hypothetical protein